MTITDWLFDLDDTLYPASTGLFRQVSKRITERIAFLLGISDTEARVLQRQYWLQYGTSLRGLILHHGVDPEPFLAYVHDVPVASFLHADDELRAMLLRLGGRRHVFTNSPQEYAARVLDALGVADLFDNVFDIRHSGFCPKPDPGAYGRVLAALGRLPAQCLLVDDAPPNLVAARACGFKTVWLCSPGSVAGGAAGDSVDLAAAMTPADVVINSLGELEGAVRVYFCR